MGRGECPRPRKQFMQRPRDMEKSHKSRVVRTPKRGRVWEPQGEKPPEATLQSMHLILWVMRRPERDLAGECVGRVVAVGQNLDWRRQPCCSFQDSRNDGSLGRYAGTGDRVRDRYLRGEAVWKVILQGSRERLVDPGNIPWDSFWVQFGLVELVVLARCPADRYTGCQLQERSLDWRFLFGSHQHKDNNKNATQPLLSTY